MRAPALPGGPVAAAALTSAVILLAMLVVSWYGWVRLPTDALVPIHPGTGYNRLVPKRFGIVMHPGAGLLVYLIYLILLGFVHSGSPNAASATRPPDVILPIALLIMLAVQV